MKITLNDWQDEANRDPEQPASLDIGITIVQDRVTLEAADGRSIAVELQNGALRLLAYEDAVGKGHPVALSIPASGDISVEMSDYVREDRPSPDAPEA